MEKIVETYELLLTTNLEKTIKTRLEECEKNPNKILKKRLKIRFGVCLTCLENNLENMFGVQDMLEVR